MALPRRAKPPARHADAAIPYRPARPNVAGGTPARPTNGEPGGHFRRKPQLSPGNEARGNSGGGAWPCGRRAFRLGKADEYYLRGYNLDHGTDMATFWDNMPINLPTNAHGQGYADLNFLIPETPSGFEIRQGAILGGRGRL